MNGIYTLKAMCRDFPSARSQENGERLSIKPQRYSPPPILDTLHDTSF